MNEDLYAILNVRRSANPAAIKRAYRVLAHKFHPDRNPGDDAAAERFKLIQHAWEVLGDAAKRSHYDATGQCDLKPDNTLGPIVANLASAMGAVLNKQLENGVLPKRVDIVKLMRNELARRREEMQKHRLNFQKGKTALTEIVERFQRNEGQGENLLRSVARKHLADNETELQKVEAAIGGLDATLEHLKEYAFAVDAMWQEFSGTFEYEPGAYKKLYARIKGPNE